MSRCININNGRVQEIAKTLNIPPALAAVKVEVWMDNNGNKIPTAEDLDPSYEVNYNLKAVEILSSDKAKQVFAKGEKAGWDLNKTLTELQIPKEQKELILSLGKTKLDDIITDLLANYSYAIEINITTEGSKNAVGNLWIEEYPNKKIGDTIRLDGEDFIITGTQEESDPDDWGGDSMKTSWVVKQQGTNTSYYSNLTVPGGTNYTEQELATPAITPNIKGHAQFATDKGIGWFRSDDKATKYEGITEYTDEELGYMADDAQMSRTEVIAAARYNPKSQTDKKTRRILEVQSDLFQKGRNKKDLINKEIENGYTTSFSRGNKNYFADSYSNEYWYNENGKNNYITLEEYQKAQDIFVNTNENQFLQLLNKNNNWVTFFVKSIIQDSAKKGYEKVLFPSGNTASKVEGHTTLEEFKKQKQDRIKQLENEIKNIPSQPEYDEDGILLGDYSEGEIIPREAEIKQLKQELERVEGPEGFGALKPIYNFYENTVANVLKKQGYTPKQITDEYGNTWNEVTLDTKRDKSISFQKEEDDFNLEKRVSENTANNQIEELTAKYPNYTFYKEKDVRLKGFSSWSVYATKKETKTPTGQLTLFAGDRNVRPNVITTVDRGTMANNKFKTFLGSNISDAQTALRKIAKSDSTLSSIAKKLLRSDLNVPIEIVDFDFFDKNNMPEGMSFDEEEDFKGSAFYDVDTNKIYVARGANAATIPLLVHEILHAYTKNYITTKPNSPAVKNFKRLLEHLRSPEISKLIQNQYPLTSMDELLTGIFTNSKFINELKSIPATNKNFKSIWNEILQIFKVIFGVKEVSLLDEIFSEASNIVELSMDAYLSGEQDGNLPNKKFTPIFSQEEPTIQNKVVSNLLSLQGKQIQEDTFYTIPGFETKLKRPSTLAKKTIQERQEFKSEAEKRKDEIYTGTGTLIHAIQADIIKKNFPEYNTHIDSFEIKPENIGIYKAVEADKQLQKVIDEAKKEGTVLMAEVFVGNLKLERGGTIDLLGITPDGNYKIYDLKTRMTLDKGARRRFNKLEEFTKQLTEYKKILEEGDVRLGVPSGKILTTQILENKLELNLKTGKVNKVNGIEFVAPLFLRTEDAKLNNFINKLKEQIDLLLGKEPKEENLREQWEKLLNSKLELMQSLQLKQDVNELISHASIELSAIKEYLVDETDADTTDLQSQLLLFASLDEYVDYDSLTDTQQYVLKNIMFESKRLHKKLIDRGKDVIVESAGNVGMAKFIDKLFSPIKDITFLRKMTMGISSVDNPLVNTGYRIVINALEKSRSKLDELKDSLVPLIEEFKETVGSLNFDMMLTDDKESLVDKHTKQFWIEYYKNKKGFNPKWAKENLNYDKAAYDEAYQNKLNFEDSIKATEIKKIEAWLMLQETKPETKEEFDKYVDNIYWKNRKERFDLWFEKYENNSYFFFKPKDKWIDPKWKEIKEGKYKGTAVEKFYDFYTNYMKVANEVAPEKIKPTFIPNFTQSFLERTGELGLFGAIQGKWSELLNELSLEYDETLYGKVDPYTGEQLRQLYIPGLSKAKQNKSVDLAASLYTFMEGVYRYQELSAIEGTINHVKYQIRNLDELKVDALGNPIDDATKIDSKKNPGKQIAEQFDYFVDAIIYNKQRKAEGGFELKGNGITQTLGLLNKGDSKLISTAKIADAVIRYTGIRNLSFNLFAPMVNLLGASANQYMTGSGGLYYSSGDLAKAQGLLTAGGTTPEGQKLKMIIEWLGIDRDKIDRDVFKKLTKVTASAIVDKYNGMTMFRESEVLLVESGAGAMILSGKNGLTMDDFDIVNGKLTFKKEILPIDKAVFKQKVLKINGSNIGSMNPDDVLLAKKWMVGRMLMQHRSWLPQLAYRRFAGKQYDYILDKEIEGRYRVAARAVKYIMMKGYSQGIESLTPDEVATAKEAFAELMLIAGTGLLLFALQGVDDEEKKEAWYKYSNTISTRLFGELFFFADPTLSSQFQILLSPAATTSTATELGKLVRDSWKEVAADMYEDPEQVRKKAKPIKRLIKMTPGAGQVQRFIDELYNPEDNK